MNTKASIIVLFLSMTVSLDTHANQLGDNLKIEMLNLGIGGAHFVSEILHKTKPGIRIVNVFIPVDMKSFKVKAAKWSISTDQKVLEWKKSMEQDKYALMLEKHLLNADGTKSDGDKGSWKIAKKIYSQDDGDDNEESL